MLHLVFASASYYLFIHMMNASITLKGNLNFNCLGLNLRESWCPCIELPNVQFFSVSWLLIRIMVTKKVIFYSGWLELWKSLLRRLQAQTLLNAISPLGNINPFSKMASTLNPWWNFDILLDLESSLSLWHSLFYIWKSYL